MSTRSGTLKAFLANVLAVFFVILPSLSEPLAAWVGPLVVPPNCSGGTITLISGDATLTLENPQISNASSQGCNVSGGMRIQLAGNNVGSIPIQGRVDAYDKFTSTSIGYFELQVASLTLKAYSSSYNGGELRLTEPAIKIPDSWGGLEARIPQTFWMDSWGLQVYEFSLPSIKTQNGIKLDLKGALGLYADGYKIEAHGSLSLPDMGSSPSCEIGVDVILYVDALGQTVLEIDTPGGTETAALGGYGSGIAYTSGQGALIPASMPWGADTAALTGYGSGIAYTSGQGVLIPASMSLGSIHGPLPEEAGLQPGGGDTAPAASPAPVAALPQPSYQPAPTAPEWGSLTITATASCDKGIVIDNTGFELTGVDGTITLGGDTEYVRLGTTFENIKPKPFDRPLLSVYGQALFQWNPEFRFDMSAVLEVMEMLEVANAQVSVSESDGFRTTVWSISLLFEVNVAIHAWVTEVRTCSAWDTWCIDPHPLPPICGSQCAGWNIDDKFHFTGSATCQVGLAQGQLWDGCFIPYPCHCRVCWAWFVPYPCCSLCWECIPIPPVDMRLGSAAVQFGEFTGDRWGLKGTVTFLGFSTGFYVDHTGHLAFGNVSGYQLIDALQLAMARQAWRAAQLGSDPEAGYPGDEAFTFLSEDDVLVHFDLPLAGPYQTPMGVTDLISDVSVITQTDTIFSVKADVPLTVTLLSPDDVEITPDNYWQQPGGYTVQYTQTASYVPVSGAGEDVARWRLVLASDLPALERVDVRLDGSPVMTDVWIYEDQEPIVYITATLGVHTLEVAPTGEVTPVLAAPLEAMSGTQHTVLAVGELVPEALVLEDDNGPPPGDGVGRVRVVNVAPLEEPVDVSLGDWSFPDLAYKEASPYQVVASGAYSLSVLSSAFEPVTATTLTDGLGFGTKVAPAGDVNGDGYADVLVGNATHDGDRGQATLYLGSPTGVYADAAWTAIGENPGDKFGVSVAGAGDVNGDGRDDVLVGANAYNSDQGKAYLYLGSEDGLSATPNWTAEGEGADNLFGGAVAGAGDVNGDGWDDILVGADGYDSSKGKAYLYYGSPTGPRAEWAETGSLTTARYMHTATHLPDGRVLVVGGENGSGPLGSAELYDVATEQWTPTDSLDPPRNGNTVTRLSDDRVLVAGGRASGGYLDSAEVYSPTTKLWTATGSLSTARTGHTATLLPDGRVLVVGGTGASGVLASAELYDPATGTFTTTGSLDTARAGHTAALLPDGRVLVAGGSYWDAGYEYPLASAELYDPDNGTWTAAGSMNVAVRECTATALLDGRVLVAGGEYSSHAELYDPAAGTWTTTGSLNTGRSGHTATLLPDGQVLVAGDYNEDRAELYDPATGLWTYTSDMASPRFMPTASLLADGRVLLAAGYNIAEGHLSSAEIYDPAADTWTASGEDSSDGFGSALTGAGDVNGDGFDDVLVGAHYYPSGDGVRGKAYLYDGTADGLTASHSWTAEGEDWGHEFGISVAGAGDVNGDGYADVLIGAYGYPTYDAYQGRAYLYQGSDAGLSSPANWTATGESFGDRLGASVTGAGDVDVDGYDDVVVGAYGYPGGADQGQVTLYHGSPTGLGTGWMATGAQATGRQEHTATRLPGGRLLVVGGQGDSGYLTSAELYNPDDGTWTGAGNLSAGRSQHTATRLLDGRVLVAGGLGAGDAPMATAELYNPDDGTWTGAAPLNTERRWHTANLLPGGKVLVAGGLDGDGTWLDSAELYDPAKDTWSSASNMTTGRIWHTANLLRDGTVLVTGHSAEVYDPAKNSWTATGPVNAGRERHSATLLADGRMLVAGGWGAGDHLDSAELYAPDDGTWTAAGSMGVGRKWHSATRLPDGRVVVAGGEDSGGSLASAEVYDPATDSWTATVSLATPRTYQAAALLPSGRVLVAGGYNASDGRLASAELYQPAVTWSATGANPGDIFGISVAGAGDVDGSGYADLIVGAPGNAGGATVYHGGVGLSPKQVEIQEGEVQTIYIGRMSGSPEPLVIQQTTDELYQWITTTQYVVDQAITGTWSLNLQGDTAAAEYLVASAVTAHNPPILEDLTVDASDLANTEVSWRLTGDYLPVTISLYANDGPITQTLGITEPETIPLFQGIEVATIPISDDLAVRNATISTTVDLSILESGNYKLWVRVEDPVNPPVQGYVWGAKGKAPEGVRAAWNQVRIAAEGYDPLAQLAGAVEIPIDHSATFGESWTTHMTPTVTTEGLFIEFTPYDHPDVDGYVLEVSEAGQTHVITTGNTLYYHYDPDGEPVGDPVHYAAFNGLTPEDTYTLRIAASDRDSGRRSWSQEHLFTVPLGDFWLGALQPEIDLPAGQEVVTATLVVTMTEDLFSDVNIYLDAYHLPPGISLQSLSYEPLGGMAGTLGRGGIPAPLRMPPTLRALASEGAGGGEITVLAHATLSVAPDVPAASYLLPFMGYSGELERKAEVTLLVGVPQDVIVDPGATDPIVLHGSLPLPSCATAINVTIPPGAFAVEALLSFRQGSSNVANWGGMRFAGSHFTLTAQDTGSGAPVEPVAPLSLMLEYDPACLGGLREDNLHLRYWTGPAHWAKDGIACTPDPPLDALDCSISHAGEFAMFELALTYLPLVLKNK